MRSRVYAAVGRPSVCPPHTAAAGLLLWARRTGDIEWIADGPVVSSSRAAAAAVCG